MLIVTNDMKLVFVFLRFDVSLVADCGSKECAYKPHDRYVVLPL